MTVLGLEASIPTRTAGVATWPSSLFAQRPRAVHQTARGGQTALPASK